jgi:hypothetical protein
MSEWNGFFTLVAEEVLLVVAFLVVFDGARRLVRDGFARRPALMVALGLLLPTWEGWQSQNLVKSVQQLQATKMATVNVYGREPEGGWEKAPLTPEQRSTMSAAVATVNYKYLGRRLQVIDEHGQRIAFAPSAALQTEREEIVRDERGAEAAALSAFDRGVHLLISAAGFLLAGLLVGWRQRKRA